MARSLAAADAALEVAPGDIRALTVRVRALAALNRGAEATSLLEQLAKDHPARAKEIEALRSEVAQRLPK